MHRMQSLPNIAAFRDSLVRQDQSARNTRSIFANSSFENIHEKMTQKSKKHMQFKWRPFNTTLFLILNKEEVYGECHGNSLCEQYLDETGRVPFIDMKRSKKVYETVMDKYLIEEEMTLEVGDFDALPMFSDHESSHESDDEIDLSHFKNVRVNVDLSMLGID